MTHHEYIKSKIVKSTMLLYASIFLTSFQLFSSSGFAKGVSVLGLIGVAIALLHIIFGYRCPKCRAPIAYKFLLVTNKRKSRHQHNYCPVCCFDMHTEMP